MENGLPRSLYKKQKEKESRSTYGTANGQIRSSLARWPPYFLQLKYLIIKPTQILDANLHQEIMHRRWSFSSTPTSVRPLPISGYFFLYIRACHHLHTSPLHPFPGTSQYPQNYTILESMGTLGYIYPNHALTITSITFPMTSLPPFSRRLLVMWISFTFTSIVGNE